MNPQKIFGNTLRIRAIDYLAKHPDEEIYPSKLASEIKATPAGVSKALEPMVEEGIVVSKQLGNMTIYKINRQNQSIVSLIDFLKK